MSVVEAGLVRLFRRFPPSSTIFQPAAGRAESEYASEETPFGFAAHFPGGGALFAGREVLDVGSGYGGRSVKFLEYGARAVVGLEVDTEKVASGRAFAEARGVADRATFVVGVGEALPFEDASFDLVTSFDTLEHVVSPGDVLSESRRVLRPDGLLAVVFPPFYDVRAGSHLGGYATRIPGLNLVFPSRTLKSAARRFLEESGVDYAEYLRDVPSDKLFNLNGLTVRGFLNLIETSGFRVRWIRYLGHLDYRRGAAGTAASMPLRSARRCCPSVARTPLVQEIACLRVCALLEVAPRRRA